LKDFVQDWAKKHRVSVMWRYLTMEDETKTPTSLRRVSSLSVGCHEIRFCTHKVYFFFVILWRLSLWEIWAYIVKYEEGQRCRSR